eukprot:g2120.t1
MSTVGRLRTLGRIAVAEFVLSAVAQKTATEEDADFTSSSTHELEPKVLEAEGMEEVSSVKAGTFLEAAELLLQNALREGVHLVQRLQHMFDLLLLITHPPQDQRVLALLVVHQAQLQAAGIMRGTQESRRPLLQRLFRDVHLRQRRQLYLRRHLLVILRRWSQRPLLLLLLSLPILGLRLGPRPAESRQRGRILELQVQLHQQPQEWEAERLLMHDQAPPQEALRERTLQELLPGSRTTSGPRPAQEAYQCFTASR